MSALTKNLREHKKLDESRYMPTAHKSNVLKMGGLISRPEPIKLASISVLHHAASYWPLCRNKNEVEIPGTSRDIRPPIFNLQSTTNIRYVHTLYLLLFTHHFLTKQLSHSTFSLAFSRVGGKNGGNGAGFWIRLHAR